MCVRCKTVVRLKLPCLWEKSQKRVLFDVSEDVVMSFCVAGVALCDTPHFVHFTLHNLHSTPLHSTLHTPHSTLFTLHFTLHTLHSTHSTLHTPHSPLRNLSFTLHTPHFTLHTLHSTLPTLHSTRFTRHQPCYLINSQVWHLCHLNQKKTKIIKLKPVLLLAKKKEKQTK